MVLDGVANLINGVGGKLIDRLWPDQAERDRAKAELLRMQQEGEFREYETRMAVVLEEARSADPWTSRARPSFLYVMYLLILACVPYGIAHAIAPEIAARFAQGIGLWFKQIPESLWWLMGAGYLGYGGLRSLDKRGLQGIMKSLTGNRAPQIEMGL